ncbi:hypothetical protein AGMMS4952_13750 [Spirochaetia bacterium]|nr:hypothetical protein AGMMS4952_13750 [Spirochaetia bacterium]
MQVLDISFPSNTHGYPLVSQRARAAGKQEALLIPQVMGGGGGGGIY